ncbi:MAG: tRNA uridine-5-carboxymethylaminomethyl(34) synthesis GTPase MnmE [Ruminococcaceae bacterium]|nr:tRNA uridine-5-carboxymethylaminomethyl(34) synthesis GTPase MnmE [Oscillospiraceae bacterium]
MKLSDTIAAISTPYGKGGVALIRISGAEALDVGDRIFFSSSEEKLSKKEKGRMYYGEIRIDGDSVDDVMAVYFKGPNSFTGEDTVEITCHGGILVTQKVFGAALMAGARAAEAGEFTRRAYINGKMRLSEAEALGNLLEAKSDTQMILARNGMRGGLADRTEKIYLSLRETLTSVYAAIDFPDEDLSEMSRDEICETVRDSLENIRRLASTYGTGRAVNEGIPTVICGRTNAGKSSVYNRILGYDAAIVTDIEGTTRDCLKESATLGKTLLRLCDTAGLRETDDVVESMGIERTKAEMSQAGLILAVFDGAKPLTDEDRGLIDYVINVLDTPTVALINKSDVSEHCDMKFITDTFENTLRVSAVSGEGFSELGELIDRLFIDGDIDIKNDAVVSGARQYASLKLADEALYSALCDLEAGIPLDLCCVAIESALSYIGEVDGRELGEEIVSEIFSKFCVGK